MALRVEHELHGRRRGRNLGLGLILVALVALVFALTVVKVLNLGDVRALEGFDFVAPAGAGSVPDPDARPTLPGTRAP